ncbi:MAG TPA: amino acid ABC transporter permease, partial [Arthrobacter sp.]|nr:amino acid ABC transporter permease [Arthrobacter sp.]
MSEPESDRIIEAEPGRTGESVRKPRTRRARHDDDAPPEAIVAIPLRHPWRNAVAVLLVLGLAVFVLDAAQRSDYGWPDVGKYLFDRRISQAAWVTLWLT